MVLVILFSVFAIVTCQGEVQSSCSQLNEAIKAKCPSLAIGGKISNRRQVEEMISSILDEVAEKNVERNAALGIRLDELERRLAVLQNSTEYLPITHKGKRYWIESRAHGMNCRQAKEICAANGGKPANIYSKEHYYLLMGQLRILAPAYGVMTAWTGLKYNEKTNKVSLSDGSPAPFLLWASGPPNRDGCISLTADQQRLSPNQHMQSMKPEWSRTGVVCEK